MIPKRFSNEDWAKNIVRLSFNPLINMYFLEVNGHTESFDSFPKAVNRLTEISPTLLYL